MSTSHAEPRPSLLRPSARKACSAAVSSAVLWSGEAITRIVVSKKPIRWGLLWARLRYWSWQLLTKVVLGIIYLMVIAEGLRLVVPALGQKIHKLPALSSLKDYEATHRLDLASFFSLFMLIGVWSLWGSILRVWLEVDREIHPSWDSDNHRRLVVSLGSVILLADACLFYAAMTQIGWGGAVFSLSALLATSAYLAMIVFVTFVSITLHCKVIDRRKDQ
jgi:hypothetical protein